MSTTAGTSQDHPLQREEVLRAVEQRVLEHPPPMSIREKQHIHDMKQQFRRLIEPGIMRPNNHENAMLALKVCPLWSGRRVLFMEVSLDS